MTLWKHGLKKFSIITEVPTITPLVAAFDARAFNCTELFKSYLARGNRIIYCHQPKSPQLKCLTKHMVYSFYKNHICFFLSVFKKTNTLHLYMCSGIKTSKHNVRTTLQVAYHACKNIYRSKTRQVKRTQMVVTVRFTIRVYPTFSDW